jgi:hypothetical protein
LSRDGVCASTFAKVSRKLRCGRAKERKESCANMKRKSCPPQVTGTMISERATASASRASVSVALFFGFTAALHDVRASVRAVGGRWSRPQGASSRRPSRGRRGEVLPDVVAHRRFAGGVGSPSEGIRGTAFPRAGYPVSPDPSRLASPTMARQREKHVRRLIC